MTHVKYLLIPFVLLLCLAACSPLFLGKTPSEENMIEALKEALTIGAERAGSSLNKTDAFLGSVYKIMLPPEASVITDNISNIPGGQALVDDVIERINRAAENAAEKIAPIFSDAIVEMTFSDAVNILKGDDDAATAYLQETTSPALKEAFKPDLDDALQAPIVLNISADDAWTNLTTAYNTYVDTYNTLNSLMGNTDRLSYVNVDLSDYVLDKALYAVYTEMAKVEKQIRDDPAGFASNIIETVFEWAKGNK
ncbi:MAG: DUF4197 domain-containing protein [Spirochaetaceae bacterium]|jgi:hypothetical protein|nr:DUF4197 domain-containing protein [Spirochaetaceae bacterium]